MIANSSPQIRDRALTDEELAAFLGEASDAYQKKRSGANGRLGGFNWPAALFTLAWLAYRKLWRWILPAFIVQIIVATSFELSLDRGPVRAGLQIVTGAALMMLFGFLANPLLHGRAVNTVEECDRDLEKIATAGGTSELAAGTVLILSFLLFAVKVLAPLAAHPM